MELENLKVKMVSVELPLLQRAPNHNCLMGDKHFYRMDTIIPDRDRILANLGNFTSDIGNDNKFVGRWLVR